MIERESVLVDRGSYSFGYPRGNVWTLNGVEVYADDWPWLRRALTRRYWANVNDRLHSRVWNPWWHLRALLIPHARVVELVRARAEQGHWANRWDIAEALGVPDKVAQAKLRRLIARGAITGCACGCRGDFELPK